MTSYNECSHPCKTIDSQPCYGDGEGTSFNALEAQTLVGDISVDVPAPIINDQRIDEETGTSLSDNLRVGIIPIDVPLGVKMCHHCLPNPS
ncbi:hypothetical protein E5676_scaffold2376G00110 [Cucumis melo var. makuwa]|uniref:Uncharacterized protein n=1 Tax=Cucumis melo var. makuwa TaxID=1194695 RepID=A0A5D3E6Y5_CUCMM|nr:hypothetical protein E6C27_scaffold60G00880 [Cucumis melo var. makuwa]TYK31609.1 hypothetical protein E5676_scaffold2376G00110 [Cucumis melo var. makuwa]